jgi:ribulose-phosphate 3-epimerase
MTSRGQQLAALAPLVLPSLLDCDFGRLADQVAALEAAGARAFHLDVMDGHFVPNFSYGLPIVEAVRRSTDRPLDAHLMISHPEQYVERFCEAGADSVTVHAETLADPRPVLARIRLAGARAGLAINPPTPVERIEPFLEACDMVLVMSVMPGFGGQRFDRVALDKLCQLRGMVPEGVLLEVDGGINEETIADCAAAGADLFVAGTAILGHPDYGAHIRRLTELARAARPA